MEKKIREEFSRIFGTEGILYASSGRINLIGEHTDYNGGFVFPGAVDKCIMLAIKPQQRCAFIRSTLAKARNSVCAKKMLQKRSGHVTCLAFAARQ